MKGLFTLEQLSIKEIEDIISLSLEFKGGLKKSYSNKKMATLFFEDSTRTQYSFQVAMINLGINVVYFNPLASSINKGESLYDTVRTFESFGLDGLVIRHQANEYYKELENVKIPILNGGDGSANHPTQSLLDLMTIYEEFKTFKGLKVCIVGDISHSRVAHTNIGIMRRLGMDVYISGPTEFDDGSAPHMDFIEACKTCDVIMLLRVQFERHKERMGITVEEYHKNYGMTDERVSQMKDKAIIMHPAPFNRGVEIASSVCECAKSRIFNQMSNGVYVRMAVISKALDGEL